MREIITRGDICLKDDNNQLRSSSKAWGQPIYFFETV